jgi:hypothetical protein
LKSTTPIQIPHLLNCIRVITRIMPFVFESPECAAWEDKFFWTPRLVEKTMADPVPDQKQQQQNQAQYHTLPPRAEVLLACKFAAL